MRLTFQILLLTWVVAISGCATGSSPQYAEVPGPSKVKSKPVVKPSNAITGRVVSFNVVGRFAILPVMALDGLTTGLDFTLEGPGTSAY